MIQKTKQYIYFFKIWSMRNITILFFMLFITNSLLAKSGEIVISGQVQNHTETSITITQIDNQKMASAELDALGNFSITSEVEEGYYFLNYGRNSASIFLHPGDKLQVIFDATNFESTIAFTGEGSVRNNYLAKKSEIGTKLTKDLDAFYKVDEATYLKNIENVKNTHLTLLASYDVENFFKKEELKSLEYERLLSIQNYKSNYKFYIGEEISPSESFYEPIRTLKLDNENDYKSQRYYRYVVNSVWSDRIEAAPNVDGMLDVFKKVPFKDLANTLAYGFYSDISSNKDRSKDYLDLIKRISKNQQFTDAAEKRYKETHEYKDLNRGNDSPQFSYETLDGNTINLSDLNGKYVYIDIWATWCSPCLKQVPYLKKLEELYNDKNIVFVSISVDKEEFKDAWKQMIADKQLGGIQLFADNSFDSKFMEAYNVNSIPRFILIDPQGKIIDAEAPQPSFDRTKKLLDALVN